MSWRTAEGRKRERKGDRKRKREKAREKEREVAQLFLLTLAT